jgi:hypothetical protein
VAIAALLLWTFTAAVGVYLLITSTRLKPGEVAPAEEHAAVPLAASVLTTPAQAAGPAPAAVPAEAAGSAQAAAPTRARDRFDPPSLRQAKSEPVPGMRALAEFSHPALAVTGFAFWIAYTLVRDRIFAAIALGIMLGAIAAGVSWATANARAAKRTRTPAPGTGADDIAGADSPAHPDGDSVSDALSFSPRVLIFHVAGAVLTLLLAALITARV